MSTSAPWFYNIVTHNFAAPRGLRLFLHFPNQHLRLPTEKIRDVF
jgi:hypothetical protein